MSADKWTADMLRTENGMHLYAEQIRMTLQTIAEDVRRVSLDVHADLEANPPEGDGALQARFHAWQVTRHLDAIERALTKSAGKTRALESTRRRIYDELPVKRAEKEHAKLMKKAGQRPELAPHQVNARPTAAPTAQADTTVVAQDRPVFNLFGDERVG